MATVPVPPARARLARWTAAAGRRMPREIGIRGRMMALVLGLALPFTIYVGALAWSQTRTDREEALANAQETARVVATRVDDFVDDADLTLRLIARSAGTDRAGFQATLDAVKHDLRPYVANIVIWTTSGEMVASLDQALLNAPFNIGDRAYFRDALRGGGLGLEAPIKARGSGDYVAVFARPVQDAHGRTVAVITLSARLVELGRVVDPGQTLPSGMLVTLLDRQGNVVSRSIAPEQWIGRNLQSTIDRSRFEVSKGSAEMTTSDGVARIAGYATVTRAPWKVYAGMPTETALAALHAQLRETTLLGAAALLTGLALAALAGNGVARRLRALADDAARLEAGELSHRSTVHGGDETGVLGKALNRMAEALDQRTRALERTTSELSQITANVPVLIAYIDAGQRYRFANEYHRDVFGVDPAALLGRTLKELFRPDAYEDMQPRVLEVLSGLPASFETTVPAKGAARCFLVSCFPDYGDDHDVRGFYAVCQDITRRRAAEESLAARERFINLITDAIPARITYLDDRGRLQFGNRHFAATWGADEKTFLGAELAAVVPPRVFAQIEPMLERGLNGESLRYELTFEGPDGPQHDIVHYVPDFDAAGKVQGLITISQDITAQKRLEVARTESEKRVRMITDNVPAAMAYVNRHERYLFANAGFLSSFERGFDDLVGRRVADVLPADVYASTKPHIDGVLRGERQRFQRLVTRLGSRRHELVEYIPEQNAEGEVTGFFALIQNITDLHDAQVRIEASEQRLRSITENIPALICYVDRGRRYRFNSRYYEEWLGRPLAEITGRTVLEVVGPATYTVDGPYIERAFEGERVDFEVEHTDAKGTRVVRGTYVPDVDSRGVVIGIYGSSTDITRQKVIEKQLERLAQHDALTGLPNRTHFNERIAAALARIDPTGLGVGLLFLDIDGFKRINDTHGHAGGDEVLREFGRRLVAAVRDTDTVARLAGDEFVVILDGVHRRDECLFVARKIVAVMRRPFHIGDVEHRVTTSIGIAMTQDAGASAEALLQKADGALYVAKAQGRDRYEIAV